MSPLAIVILAIVSTIVFAGALVWLAVWWRRKAAEQHARDLQAYQSAAAQRGWRYAERDDSFANFAPPCPAGYWNPLSRVEHVLTGTHQGRPLFAAYFQFKNGWHDLTPAEMNSYRYSDEYARTHEAQSPMGDGPLYVRHAGLHLPVALPELRVVPMMKLEKAINRKAGLGGWNSGNPVLDDQFDIETPNPQLAQDVLHPEMIDYLARNRAGQGRGFVITGDWMFLTMAPNSLTDLAAAADFLCGVYDRLPVTIRPQAAQTEWRR